jgi:hypothetical protein
MKMSDTRALAHARGAMKIAEVVSVNDFQSFVFIMCFFNTCSFLSGFSCCLPGRLSPLQTQFWRN